MKLWGKVFGRDMVILKKDDENIVDRNETNARTALAAKSHFQRTANFFR